MKKVVAISLTIVLSLVALITCCSLIKSHSKKSLTKFEKQFSVQNEKLLKTILDKGPQQGDVLEYMPLFRTAPTSQYNAGDSAYTFIYEDASKSLYDQYCEALRSSNYAQYTEVEFNGTQYKSTTTLKNYFTTFVNSVSQIDIGFHEFESRMYVTATPRVNSVLPQRDAPSYNGKKYPMLWTQLGVEDLYREESSLGLIVRLTDGTFLIIDSNHHFDETASRIYKILKKQAPDPNNIVISAWILTHAHMDHVGGFMKFANAYGKDSSITIKQLAYNFPDDSVLPEIWIKEQNYVRNAIKKINYDVEILKPHTGNILYYPGLSINILYTQENYLPIYSSFENYNASSIVTQFILEDGNKILVGADHPVDGSSDGIPFCKGALWRWYGSFIESNVVSTFHHGLGGGADNVVYHLIKPKIVLWCATEYKINVNNLKSYGFNEYFTDENADSRGVIGYFIAKDDITLLSFRLGAISVTQYDNIDIYLEST